VVLVLGLGILELNILRDYLIREVAPADDEIATLPQVPISDLAPQPPMTLEELTPQRATLIKSRVSERAPRL
jgi:hypothetical protein